MALVATGSAFQVVDCTGGGVVGGAREKLGEPYCKLEMQETMPKKSQKKTHVLPPRPDVRNHACPADETGWSPMHPLSPTPQRPKRGETQGNLWVATKAHLSNESGFYATVRCKFALFRAESQSAAGTVLPRVPLRRWCRWWPGALLQAGA